MVPVEDECTFDGCDKQQTSRYLCSGHYQQQRKGQRLTPLDPYTPRGMTLHERLDLYTARGADDECWPWTHTKDNAGYGRFGFGGASLVAHRESLARHLGHPIPADMDVHHRCYNPPCVNPAHLEVMTPLENRGAKRRKRPSAA